MSVRASPRVHDLLNSMDGKEWGWLIGGASDQVRNICNIISGASPSSVSSVLPHGVPVVGVVLTAQADEKTVKEFAKNNSSQLSEACPGGKYLFLCGRAAGVKAFLYDAASQSCVAQTWQVEPDVTVDRGFKSLLALRLAFTHSFSCSAEQKAIQNELHTVESVLSSSGCFASAGSDDILELGNCAGVVGDLFAEEKVEQLPRLEQRTVQVTLLKSHAAQNSFAPYLLFTPAKQQAQVRVHVSFDVLCLASRQQKLQDVLQALLESAKLQVKSVQALLVDTSLSQDTTVTASHFWPHVLPHPVTICSLNGSTESLLPFRQRWHAALYLPEWPFLRPAVALSFSPPTSDRLRNVHLFALPSGVAGGKQTLVQGNYDYYHYMQDKFNDDGWGCAYRTFMTICSWYLLQGFTTVPVPNHRAIQLALVEMGEKQKEIIGSKQWLGSIELGLALDHMLGYQAKILSISSGSEIPNHARQLVEHFRTEGTPAMIGGGQFAYGLLGVDFNETTGDVKFLILDPHYKGAEDIREITTKKWCSWYKAADIFENNCFYNFCLPMRPRLI